MKEVPAIENEKARKMIESTNMFSNSQKYRCKRPTECIKFEKSTEIVQECVEIGEVPYKLKYSE